MAPLTNELFEEAVAIVMDGGRAIAFGHFARLAGVTAPEMMEQWQRVSEVARARGCAPAAWRLHRHYMSCRQQALWCKGPSWAF